LSAASCESEPDGASKENESFLALVDLAYRDLLPDPVPSLVAWNYFFRGFYLVVVFAEASFKVAHCPTN